MSRLFRNRDDILYSDRTGTRFINLGKLLKINIEKFTLFYQSFEGKVDNNNTFVRILSKLKFRDVNSPLEALTYVSTIKSELLRAMNIISYTSLGMPDSRLIDMELTEDKFSITLENFEHTKFVKILTSDEKDMGMNLTHQRHIETNEIIGIDIIAMGLTYYFWLKERYLLDLSTDPAIFVYQIVNTSLALDRLPFTMFSLIIDRLNTGEMLKIKFRDTNPITLANLGHFHEEYLNGLYKILSNKKRTLRMQEILFWIKLPIYSNAYELNLKDFGFINRNNRTHISLIEGELLFKLIDIVSKRVAMSKNPFLRIGLNQMKRDLFGDNLTPKQEDINERVLPIKRKLLDY